MVIYNLVTNKKKAVLIFHLFVYVELFFYHPPDKLPRAHMLDLSFKRTAKSRLSEVGILSIETSNSFSTFFPPAAYSDFFFFSTPFCINWFFSLTIYANLMDTKNTTRQLTKKLQRNCFSFRT